MGQKQQLIWDLPPIESFYLNASIYEIKKSEAKKELKNYRTCSKLKKSFSSLQKLSLGQHEGGITGALIHKPKILFLDEPTLGLDINAQRNPQKILTKIQQGY